MTRTYLQNFNRVSDGETPITVEYTTAEDGEIKIVKAFYAVGPVTLTAVEEERIYGWLTMHHEDGLDK
jgi:hypothetical protein